ARAPAEVRRVRIDYDFGPGSVSSYGAPTFAPGNEVSAQFTLKTARGRYSPPGARITYRYTGDDAAGHPLTPEPKTFRYLDSRFRWQTSSSGLVTVYHHDAAENTVRATLTAALQTIDRVGQEAGVRHQTPLTVVAYNSVRELDAAVSFRSR